MTRVAETVWCDGCGVEILWAPLARAQRHFCCENCADGLACQCGERMELDERRRAQGHTVAYAESGFDA